MVKIDGRFNSRSMIIRNFDHPAFLVRYINSDSAVSGEVGPQEDMASSAPEHSIHSVLPLRFVFACYCCRFVLFSFYCCPCCYIFVLWTFLTFLHTLPTLYCCLCCSICCAFICLFLCFLFVIVCVDVVCAANMLQTTYVTSIAGWQYVGTTSGRMEGSGENFMLEWYSCLRLGDNA